MAVQVNEKAMAHLSNLIEDGKVANESWVDSRPSNDEEISYIEENGWEAFSLWHLALDTGAGQFSKRRYEHLVGDFENVYPEALELARERAARLGFENVREAANTLLESIQEKAAG